MRYKEPYILTKRTLPSGKTVYYYYIYDEEGNRKKFSTGQNTKSKAKHYCYMLQKQNKLLPTSKNNITFSQYTEDWWDWEKCPYVMNKRKRGHNITRNYCDINRSNLMKHLIPVFGNIYIIKNHCQFY